MRLDRQCRTLHVRNFQQLGDARSWLFLNVDPYVVAEGPKFGPFFSQMLQSSGFPAHRVAVELLQTPVEGEKRPAAAVEHYPAAPRLPLIDDFGAGHSKFARLSRAQPDA